MGINNVHFFLLFEVISLVAFILKNSSTSSTGVSYLFPFLLRVLF